MDAGTSPRCEPRRLTLSERLTDGHWAIVEPIIPPARHGGRRRSLDVHEVLNGIFYILWIGCQWKALPRYYSCLFILKCAR